jgi:hypothetical protein
MSKSNHNKIDSEEERKQFTEPLLNKGSSHRGGGKF